MNFAQPIVAWLFVQTAWPLCLAFVWMISVRPDDWIRGLSLMALALLGAALAGVWREDWKKAKGQGREGGGPGV